MKKSWQWAVSLGAIWWLVSMAGFFYLSIDEIASNFVTILEFVALTIGITYAIFEFGRLYKLPWRIIWAELGTTALVTIMIWVGLVSLSLILLSEASGELVTEVTNSIGVVVGNPVGNWSQWAWLPKLMIQMGVTMAIPVVIAKLTNFMFEDLRRKYIKKK